METDEQIATRKERERRLKVAWRKFRADLKKAPKRQRRLVNRLPAANPSSVTLFTTPKATAKSGSPKKAWGQWSGCRQRP